VKAGKYTVKEFFLNRHVQQVVIPEIQRDYVWGKDQVEGLFSSILADYREFKKGVSVPQLDGHELQDDFEQFLKRRNYSSNIGFIYAYSDDELPGRYFLIDGQQRLTTINLMLLALVVSDRKNLADRYKKTFLNEKQLKLSYKVRESAQSFLNHFVEFELSGDAQGRFNDQLWYLDDFVNDKTITSITEVYAVIKECIMNAGVNSQDLYDYIENYTEFWYFDTNVSEQGEELYIYMNARGEQMQSNENMKADLLSRLDSIEDKNKYGTIWEQWQDYFWKNRATGMKTGNENADTGFNEFLSCTSGLERYLVTHTTKPAEPYSVELKAVLGKLNLKRIESYINALKQFEELGDQVATLYPGSSWYPKAINLMWSLINAGNTNWWADYSDDNRGTEQNHMVFVWAILHLFESTQLEAVEQIRFVRRAYLQHHNYVRSVGRIKGDVQTCQQRGLDGVEEQSHEMILKRDFLKRYDASLAEQRTIEQAIWEIEDHPLNLKGRDVGGTNISHLVDLSRDDISVDNLIEVRDRFHELFPMNKTGFFCHKLIHVLLQYGSFWHQVSPWYYKNYEFDEWERTVRGKGSLSDENHFRNMFDELIDSGKESFIFLDEKNAVDKVDAASEERNCLLWYSSKLGATMWKQGKHIALTEGRDSKFSNVSKVFNTKGNFKGGSPCEVFSLLADKDKAGC
jgi:hypothetical protein